MEYFAGLDISMEETHICILDREGVLIREGKTSSVPKAIAAFLSAGRLCCANQLTNGSPLSPDGFTPRLS
jgi:transposase